MGLLGAHVSVAGGVGNAPQRGVDIGCEAIQIFSKNQLQWYASPLKKEEAEAFKREVKKNSLGTMIHDSYLINLASKDPRLLKKSREGFVEEIKRAEALGIELLNFHPGAHMGAGEEAGIKNIAESLNRCHSKTDGMKVVSVLENMAGQGSVLGGKWEHLAAIMDLVEDKKRVGVCVDTCHTYAAGHDIVKDYDGVFREVEKIIGIRRVKAFHINDAKSTFESHLDRHEEIGHGKIGKEFFRKLVNDKRFEKHPMILETPGGEPWYKKNLVLLKSLRK